MKIKDLPLSKIDKNMYLSLQNKIEKLSPIRVNFDEVYEKKYLAKIGWL